MVINPAVWVILYPFVPIIGIPYWRHDDHSQYSHFLTLAHKVFDPLLRQMCKPHTMIHQDQNLNHIIFRSTLEKSTTEIQKKKNKSGSFDPSCDQDAWRKKEPSKKTNPENDQSELFKISLQTLGQLSKRSGPIEKLISKHITWFQMLSSLMAWVGPTFPWASYSCYASGRIQSI